MRRPPRQRAPLTRERAWSYTLWLLGRQAYSAAEVERRLLQRGLSPEDAAATVERLQALQLLDDAAYAESYVRARQRSTGPIALRQALRRKGVDDAHVASALVEAGSDDLVATAQALLERNTWRFSAVADPDLAVAQRAARRALAFLARRGFAPDSAHEAFERWRDGLLDGLAEASHDG